MAKRIVYGRLRWPEILGQYIWQRLVPCTSVTGEDHEVTPHPGSKGESKLTGFVTPNESPVPLNKTSKLRPAMVIRQQPRRTI
jgi:hypothetical protein